MPTPTDGKTIKLREDGRNYVTKIKTDDKGDISSMKVRRTIKGFLTGAPRVSKVEAQAAAKTSTYKKGGMVGTSKKTKMAKGGSVPFGMLSVKAGVDKNPKPTAADRIAGAKMKKGGNVGKPKMKMGGSMKSKKC